MINNYLNIINSLKRILKKVLQKYKNNKLMMKRIQERKEKFNQ